MSKFLYYFLWAILSFSLLSCGDDDNDGDDITVVTTPPAEPPQEEEDPENRTIRYNSITLEGIKLDESFHDNMRIDLNRRPVIVAAHIEELVHDEEGEPERQACDFQVTLTENQADRLEAYADRLRTCAHDEEGDIAIDPEEMHHITLVDTSGASVLADRDFFEDVDQTYLCRGKISFYSYLRSIVKDDVPATCPHGVNPLLRL